FISLFTSLYMTRLMFDIWFAKNWLHKLSMFRLFARPNIDFMRIRYYWFTATIALTIIGIAVFVGRLPADLNIDFVGGTAYGGQLTEAADLSELRQLLGPENQKRQLRVVEVRQLPAGNGFDFEITYQNEDGSQTKRTVELSKRPVSDDATAQEREADVKARAGQLPDVSVEQIFPGFEENTGNRSRFFTIRTSERAWELVQ